MKILVTPTSMQPQEGKVNPALEKLREFADELVFNPTGKPLTGERLIQQLQGCDGYLAGLDSISADVLEHCPNLKAISRYGVGYDRVDLAAAEKQGIVVTNTPGVNAEAVGELAFGMMMSLSRSLTMLDASTKRNGWIRCTGKELYGKKIGIVGLGAIGKVVARCAGGFAMEVLAYDPYMNESYAAEHGIKSVSFEELIAQCDYISMHLPLNDQTYHMINKETFSKMKDGVILINASRGGIVDEAAAKEAVESGKLGGLGLDAFETEPPKDSPLFAYDNVLATPHTGAHTKEATENMATLATENLIQVRRGEECQYTVTAH